MAPADAGPAPECETPVLEASCRFDGHGTECEVPCELPPDCSYRVTVEWLGSYCACDLVRNVFTDCRCTEGRSLCLVPGGRWRDVPTNPCEGGCPDAGAATDGGTGPLDAGLDASSDDDAGAADASSEAWTDASS